MSSNSLSSQNFSIASAQRFATVEPIRRARVKAARATARPKDVQPHRNKGSKAFHERRSSRTRRVSLAATPRPAKAEASACDRVTMIARLACWLAIGGYLTVLSLELVSLYTS